MRRTMTFLAALLLLATLALASAVSANRLEFTNVGSGEEITAQTTEATFSNAEFGIRIRCNSTFRGRYEPVVSKVSGSHIGNYTFAGASGCTTPEGNSASVTFLEQRSPWETKYRSFTGTLPSISRVLSNIAQLEFLIRVQIGLQIFACLYRAEAEALIITEPRSIAYLAEAGARLVSTLSGICPVIIRLGGSYPFAASSLTMRLI